MEVMKYGKHTFQIIEYNDGKNHYIATDEAYGTSKKGTGIGTKIFETKEECVEYIQWWIDMMKLAERCKW